MFKTYYKSSLKCFKPNIKNHQTRTSYHWSTYSIQLQHRSGTSYKNIEKNSLMDSFIRVDHAGEFGAQRIYEGQLEILKESSFGQVIQEMANQETKHLKTFETLVRERRVRPTLMNPVWSFAGYAAGFGSALFSKEAAMALTVAIEDVIGEHYNSQLRSMNELGYIELDEDLELKQIIREFRDDELNHLETGIKHNAESIPLYNAFTTAIKSGTKLAIWISSRI